MTTTEQVTDLEALRTTSRATLNIIEIAALLGIGRRSASRAIDAGDIPHIAVGQRRLIPTESGAQPTHREVPGGLMARTAKRQYGEGNISAYTTKSGVRYRAEWHEPIDPNNPTPGAAAATRPARCTGADVRGSSSGSIAKFFACCIPLLGPSFAL